MITIPKQHYVGLKVQETNPIPLGFLTPFGTDKAFEKRKGTVDSWAGPSKYWNPEDPRQKPRLEPKVVDNVPVDGYKVAEEVRRYGWGKGNVVWRMQDPRGFEFEISSPNLARILDCATIINGVIQGPCLFGRDGAQNVLLPIASEPYVTATKNTTRANKRIPLREIKPGDVIVVKDGRTGIYVGSRNVIVRSTEYDRETYNYINPHYKVTTNFADFKQRYLVAFPATKHEEDGKFPYCHKLSRFMNEGEQYMEAFSDLHVFEVLKTSHFFLDKELSLIPSNMADAYAVLSTKAKVADISIKLKPHTLKEFYDLERSRSWKSPTGFIFENSVPYHLRMSNETYPIPATKGSLTPMPFDSQESMCTHLATNPVIKYTSNIRHEPALERTYSQIEAHTIWVAVMEHQGTEIVINA